MTVFRRTYVRFKQAGVSSTLEGRLHLLAANAVNVLVFIIYWSLFTVPYFVTYQVFIENEDGTLFITFLGYPQLLLLLFSIFTLFMTLFFLGGNGADFAAHGVLLHFIPCPL